MTRGNHGYKYQMLCHNPCPLPRGKEGSLTAKSPNLSAKNVIWPNRTHSFVNLQAKFFNYVLWQNFQRIKQNSLISPTYSVNYAKFAPIIDPFTLCFRYLPRQRTLRNSSELCKFHAICPHSPQIMRHLHHLLTYYTLCFRCLTSGRELPKIPANQAKLAKFAHTTCELCELRAFRTKIHPHLVD